VNAIDLAGNTCLHLILRLLAKGDAGKHPLVDVFNTVEIPLVSLHSCLSSSLSLRYFLEMGKNPHCLSSVLFGFLPATETKNESLILVRFFVRSLQFCSVWFYAGSQMNVY